MTVWLDLIHEYNVFVQNCGRTAKQATLKSHRPDKSITGHRQGDWQQFLPLLSPTILCNSEAMDGRFRKQIVSTIAYERLFK